MPSNIVSSLKAFSAQYRIPKAMQGKGERKEALKSYFERGGVVSVKKSGGGWPTLIYPSFVRLKSQINELEQLKQKYVSMQRQWEREERQAKSYHLKNNILKLSEPLYWKHLAKIAIDKDYKHDAEQVKLPAYLVNDPRWKPMVKMFVNDIEYRKQLVETVQNSIVYRKDRRVAKYADTLQSFKIDMSGRKIVAIKKKVGEIDGEINALRVMVSWAKEG